MIPFRQPSIELSGLGFRRRSRLRWLRRRLERRKSKILQPFHFRRHIQARNDVGEIIRHCRLGLLELLQLRDERTHENESGLIVFHQGGLELIRREVAQPQLYSFDQAFIGEGQKVGAIFCWKLGRAGRDIEQSALGFDLLAISNRQKIEHEVQVCVLDIVNRELRASADNDRVMIAKIAEIRAIADQRLNEHGKGAPLHGPQNFAQVGVRHSDHAPDRRLIAGDSAVIFGLDWGPPNITMSLMIKTRQDFLETVESRYVWREKVWITLKFKRWRRTRDQGERNVARECFARICQGMVAIELANSFCERPLKFQ